jgi:ASC-1-like (ASCH) protein
MDWKSKYQKYKKKYLELKNNNDMNGGGKQKRKKMKKYTSYGNISNLDKTMSKADYIETVSEPWFTLISMGLKTVEGRKNKGRFKEMKVGDIVEWTNSDFIPRSVKTRIVSKGEYVTFKEYLDTEGLDKCLPGIKNIDHGLAVYFKYFTKKDEEEFGVVAIRLELLEE